MNKANNFNTIYIRVYICLPNSIHLKTKKLLITIKIFKMDKEKNSNWLVGFYEINIVNRGRSDSLTSVEMGNKNIYVYLLLF